MAATVSQVIPVAGTSQSLTITSETRLVVFVVTNGNALGSVSGVSYGAQSLTPVSGGSAGSGSSGGGSAIIAYELTDPAPGTANVAISTSLTGIGMVVYALSDAGVVTVCDATASSGGSSRTVTLTVPDDDSLLISGGTSNQAGDAGTPGGSDTEDADFDSAGTDAANKCRVFAAHRVDDAGSRALTWTADDGAFSSVACMVALAVAPGSAPSSEATCALTGSAELVTPAEDANQVGPWIVGVTSGHSTSASSSHAFTVPAGEPGDLLLLLVNGPYFGVATATGWEYEALAARPTSLYLTVLTREADGSEAGGTIGLPSSAHTAWSVLRIRDADRLLNMVTSVGLGTGGTDDTPDPAGVTLPDVHAGRNLILAVAAWYGDVALSTYPDDYLLARTTERTAASTGRGLAVAARSLADVSDDPDPFGLAGSAPWAILTIGVPGAALRLNGSASLSLPAIDALRATSITRPVADEEANTSDATSTAGDTDLWDTLDETAPSDVDYVYGAVGEIARYGMWFAPQSPRNGCPHLVRLRVAAVNVGGAVSTGDACSMRVTVGSFSPALLTTITVPEDDTSWTTVEIALPDIDDPLYFDEIGRLLINVDAVGDTGDRQFAISWAEYEITGAAPASEASVVLTGSAALSLPAQASVATTTALTGSGTLDAPAGATARASAALTGTAALLAPARAVATTSAALTGGAAVAAPAGAIAESTVALTGSVAIAAPSASLAATTASLSGVASLVLPSVAIVSTTVGLTGSAALTAPCGAASRATADLIGSATVTAPSGASAAATFALAGSAVLVAPAEDAASGDVTVALTGSASLTAPAGAVASATFGIAAAAIVHAPAGAAASTTTDLTGTAQLEAPAAAIHATGASLTGQAVVTAPSEAVTPGASVSLVGAASVLAPAGALASATVALTGSASVVAPSAGGSPAVLAVSWTVASGPPITARPAGGPPTTARVASGPPISARLQ